MELIHIMNTVFMGQLNEPVKQKINTNFSDLYAVSNGDKKFVLEMLTTLQNSLTESEKKILNIIDKKNAKFSLLEELHRIAGPLKHIEANEVVQVLESIEKELQNVEEYRTQNHKEKLINLFVLFDELIGIIKIEKGKNL